MGRRGAEIPSPEGIDIQGIGTVASLPYKRGWFRRNANNMRIAADGVATVGLIPILAALATKSGATPEALANGMLLAIPTLGFVTDAADRYVHSDELSGDPLLIEPPKGTVSAPSQESHVRKARRRIAQGIYNAAQTVGHPALVLVTAELIKANNIPEAVITAGAEVILLSNYRRQKNIVTSLSVNEEGE